MTTKLLTRATLTIAVCLAAAACSEPAAPKPIPRPQPPPPLPAATFQQIAADLVARSKAPGAILGVVQGNQRWVGAAGSADLSGAKPMPADGIFRAASITKMFTASVLMNEIDAGHLHYEDRLSSWEPGFPNASSITVDQLMSHTAGVTTLWFDDPMLQGVVTADLTRVFTPEETIAIMQGETPFGAPGASGMQYSNTDYVLLGEVVHQETGADLAGLMKSEVFDRVPLSHTTYQFEAPMGLVSGWYEYQGATLDMAKIPVQALVSFAGAAGAVHSTADDLLSFADALFRKKSIVGADSLAHMMTPAETDSWYAHGLMRFCPCSDGPLGTQFTGWGHAGNLPGYWSEIVYFPERDVIVSAMINRDVVNGVLLDHTIFEPTLQAVLDALPNAAP